MPESSASERPSIEPVQTDMKEVPSTADMRILAEMHGNKPQGVDFGSDKPSFTFQIGQEPKTTATGSQNETGLETINMPSSTPRRTEESRTHAADPLDALSSDHFSRVADEAIRTARTGELGNEISLDDIIRQTAAQDESRAALARDFLGREAQRHGARVHQRTNRDSNRTSVSRPPQRELVDNLVAPDGDLPPLPFAGNIEGDQRGQSLVEEKRPLPDTSDEEAGYRFGMPPLPRESNEQGQDNEETPEARATMNRVKRLAELPFVKTWIDRVKGYVTRQSESNLVVSQEKTAEMKSKGLKIDPRLGVALIGLAAVYAVILGRAGHGVGNGAGAVAEPLPSTQYGPVQLVYDRPGFDETTQRMDRPQLPSMAQVEESLAVEPALPARPDNEKIQFPDNVKDRSVDGLVRKKLVELDPGFQKWLQETGTVSANVATDNPEFQAALFRVTQKMGGPNLEKVVKKLVQLEQSEIATRNLGRILDEKDKNKIARSQFEMKAIDSQLVSETLEKVKNEQSTEADEASKYIKSVVNTSSDPEIQQLLDGLGSSDQFILTQTIQSSDIPYQLDLYEITGKNGEPLMGYQVERRSDGSVVRAVNFRKDGSGKFNSVRMGDEPGISNEDQKKILTEALPGVDLSTFKSSMGRYENGGFGTSLYGDWVNDKGERYSGGIDAVGRISIRQN